MGFDSDSEVSDGDESDVEDLEGDWEGGNLPALQQVRVCVCGWLILVCLRVCWVSLVLGLLCAMGARMCPMSEGWAPVACGCVDTQIWRTLARCDGLCGLMLGHAVAKGPEAVRAWTCCLVQWGPVVQAQAAVGPHARTEQTSALGVEVSGGLAGGGF